MLNYLWIGIGSAIGGMLRYLLSGLIASRLGETFPYGTLFVNVSGCFLVGAFWAVTGTEGRFLVPPSFRQFFVLGICGGYTTFSSFGLQTLNLARDGEWFLAGANSLLSLMLCLVAVWLGMAAGFALNRFGGRA